MDVLDRPPKVGFADLDAPADRVALVTADGALTYRELAERVDDAASRLGLGRKLVMVAATNEVESLVAYLAALRAGHPVLLAPGDNPQAVDALAETYDPDVVVAAADGAWDVVERRRSSAHVLHPELALLLSTSGSTGSPKLVRLSHRNLQANAESIAAFLGIRGSDRAMLSLPMHYCYGLSVVNSHLLRGASVVMTGASVVDRCFWDTFRATEATSFAGVPYTFDLLDRVGFESMSLPSLRVVTQAGGRLDPQRVRRYAELGRRRGWHFFVMYGQTEATARMAYLPPEAARSHPTAIGVPVPGGSFDIEPLDESDGSEEGELVYRGPNVMLGYAERPSDLAVGRTVHALRTGDIARRVGDGLYEVVGRRSRFLKLFGLRIDLEQVERVLGNDGIRALCTGDDDALAVAVASDVDRESVLRTIRQQFGLPPSAVRVCVLPELPRLANGKPDYVAIRRATHDDAAVAEDATGEQTVRHLFAEVLRRPDVDDDSTFVSLGVDSLSYVEMSVALEELLGFLPAGWHTLPVRQLVPTRSRRRLFTQVETTAVLRAVAIVLVVGTHAGLFAVRGGAHVLLAVAGFNFARFQLTATDEPTGRHRMWGSLARMAVPSVILIAALVVATDRYGVANVLLLNDYLGAPRWDERWHYWYIEVLVQTLAVLAVAFSFGAVRRWERQHGFAFAVALLLMGLAVRFDIVGVGDTIPFPRPHTVFWVFALGWAAARSTSSGQRLLLSIPAVLAVQGFFADPWREGVVAVGLLVLLWVPTVVVVVRPLNRVAGLVGSASLYVYLLHFHVYPPLLRHSSPAVAVVASLGVGIACWSLVHGRPSSRTVRPFLSSLRQPAQYGHRWPSPRSSVRSSYGDKPAVTAWDLRR